MTSAASTQQSLRHTEALARAELLEVESYDVRLDLTLSREHFGSVTTIVFIAHRAGETFVDLRPVGLNSLVLNGRRIDATTPDRGRLAISAVAGRNELVVDAVMGFRRDGEGLHRSTDPADQRDYVYGMSFMDAAPSIFACFDQPDLKAPYTLHVTAPHDWTVIGNAPSEQVEPGVWELATTPPLSTYFVTLVAGPYHVVRGEHDGIRLGLSARASIAADLDKDADELFTLTRQCFDEFHRLFGIRYPFGDYHQAFVPEFNAGAMENPGCVTFRDPLVFSSRVTRGVRIARATTVAHEMAHQWFGNLVTPAWWDDLWLNESFAEYLGNRVTADVTQYADAWTHTAHSRRQWGLVADQRPSTHPVASNGAADAATALQDFDGISYAKGSAVLKQLNSLIGDEIFLAGTIDHFTRHRFGNATMRDLLDSWERAGAGDLSDFAGGWLRTSGADTLRFDRRAGTVRRTPPAADPAARSHALQVATARPGRPWHVEPLVITADETPYAAAPDAAVVLDPWLDTWALTEPDQETVVALRTLLPTADPLLRAGAWNGLRSAWHNARLDPADVLELAEAALPTEDNDDAWFYLAPWAITQVAPLTRDRLESLARIHRVATLRLSTAPPGSTLQLAALQAAIGSATDPDVLRAWLGKDRPEGVELDLDLRWAVLVRLASLGAVSREELSAALEAEPTARSRVEHTRAIASLPDDEAKAWAWERFTGAADVPNYELEAAGHGMWRDGQEPLTHGYAHRWLDALDDLPDVHAGWVLGSAVRAFAPLTELTESFVAAAQTRIDAGDLDRTVHRNLVDVTDEIERRLAVRRRWAATR